MSFTPEKITRNNILAAVRKIEREKHEIKPSTRWHVMINGNPYPPKEIMRYAHEDMNGKHLWHYGGGDQTNKWLEKLGFMVVGKNDGFDPIKDMILSYKNHIKQTKLHDELYKWELIDKYRWRPNTEAIAFYS
ncbi:hypothetical protein GYB22_03440 [bacterium]|nr:hypothetical protein [bacterium]